MQTTTIEIDFDIYKLIENERRSFSEKQFHALRRLLGLPDLAGEQNSASPKSDGRPWQDEGVIIPHGSIARMEYGRGSQVYEGQFLHGFLIVDGVQYATLSAAASALAKTKEGGSTSLNGWNYWAVQLPGSDRWEQMEHLRKRAKGQAQL